MDDVDILRHSSSGKFVFPLKAVHQGVIEERRWRN